MDLLKNLFGSLMHWFFYGNDPPTVPKIKYSPDWDGYVKYIKDKGLVEKDQVISFTHFLIYAKHGWL